MDRTSNIPFAFSRNLTPLINHEVLILKNGRSERSSYYELHAAQKKELRHVAVGARIPVDVRAREHVAGTWSGGMESSTPL